MDEDAAESGPEKGLRTASTRREFLAAVLAAAGAPATQRKLRGSARPAGRSVTRRNLSALRPADPSLRALRKAIDVLNRRAQSAGGSWAGLARVHASACAEGGHESALFLPWHRVWLHTVEKALQDAAGDPGLALPYWDWSRDRMIPPAFLAAGTPLFDESRQSIQEAIPPDFADPGPAFRARTLEGFAGSPNPEDSDDPAAGIVERTVAGNVRQFAGGNVSDCARAALDPLYLAHCANVDRLWEAWRKANPERAALSEEWRTASVKMRSGSGAARSWPLSDIIDPAALAYRYDSLEFEAPPRDDAVPDGARRAVMRFERTLLPELPVTFRLFFNNRDALPSTAPKGSTYSGTYTLFPESIKAPEVAIPLEVSAEMGHRISVQANVAVSLIPLPLPGRPRLPQVIRMANARLLLVEGGGS